MGGNSFRNGPYHRVSSTSQSDDDVAKIVASGELWGTVARGGYGPSVKAYIGPLGNQLGIEFLTQVPHRKSGHPHIADWREGMMGVTIDGDYAKIKVQVTRNTQNGTR